MLPNISQLKWSTVYIHIPGNLVSKQNDQSNRMDSCINAELKVYNKMNKIQRNNFSIFFSLCAEYFQTNYAFYITSGAWEFRMGEHPRKQNHYSLTCFVYCPQARFQILVMEMLHRFYPPNSLLPSAFLQWQTIQPLSYWRVIK